MTKNVFINIDFKNEQEFPEEKAKQIARNIANQNPEVKSIQYRYGAFGRVDKIKNDG